MKITFDSITKRYGELIANDAVTVSIESGTIHAIIGENGAGKSTLVKMLSGQVTPDSGSIAIDDKVIKGFSTHSAIELGIGLLGQDPMDFKNLTVMQSFTVGHRLNTSMMRNGLLRQEFERLNSVYAFNIDPKKKIYQLSIGERQQVELMRLLSNGAKVIILDEPNSGFSLEQKSKVFDALDGLTEEGCTVILVSHKLEDVLEYASSVSIMRKGTLVDTLDLPQSPGHLVDLMFGGHQEESVLQTESMTDTQNLVAKVQQSGQTIDLNLSKGMMVGAIGLQGSGVDTFLRNMFYDKSFLLTDAEGPIDKSSFGYVPADRLERGLFPELSILDHHALSSTLGHNVIDWTQIRSMCEDLIKEYGIIGTPETKAHELSGGNQQRLMLSMMRSDINVAMLEHPTRGLDIQSADYIWDKLLNDKLSRTVTLFSSYDVDEIWNYSDYVLCFHGEDIVASCSINSISKTDIINNIAGNVIGRDE